MAHERKSTQLTCFEERVRPLARVVLDFDIDWPGNLVCKLVSILHEDLKRPPFT